MTKSPTLPAFLATARNEFGFLSKQFGFSELQPPANPFAVRYGKENVEILIKGTAWGFGTNLLITADGATVPLWAIARIRSFEFLSDGDQLAQLHALARQLLHVAPDILSADTGRWADLHQAFRKIVTELEIEALHKAEAENDRRALSLSESAFRIQDWRGVVTALAPREARLSKAAAARLTFARTRLLDEA